MKEEFLKWWNENGKLGADPSFYLLKAQGDRRFKRDDVRKWVRELGGGIAKTPERPQVEITTAKLLKILESGLFNPDREQLSKINGLINDGYNIIETNGVYKLEKSIVPENNIYSNYWDGNSIFRFGVVSDTHLCNKFQQLTFLNFLYDTFEKEGIKTVYHSGDLTDGDIRRNKYELFKYGADEQTDYVIEKYPRREGITTEFITGNHDHWHINNGGVDIGKMIARERKDMKYLGCANAIINLTPNCKLELNHPLDGAAYALSYSIQKYMDSMSGGEKPNILINGHHHKAMYVFYRNIHAIEAGCVEAQTPFMKGKRIAANVGGWIIEVNVDTEGTITRFIPTFIPQYYSITKDYQ